MFQNFRTTSEQHERGLWPPNRWLARVAMRKTEDGDAAAGARLVAKLSQV